MIRSLFMFKLIFAGCLVNKASAVYKRLDEENSPIDLFMSRVKMDIFPEQFGINVTWKNLNDSFFEGRIFLVEYKDASSTSYSRLLTDNRYIYVFNLRPRTSYVFCLHLGKVASNRLLDKNCILGTTKKTKEESWFEKSIILTATSSGFGLILGFLIGYFYKRYRMLSGKKEETPDISPRPFWTLNYRPGENPNAPSDTASTASYITVQDQVFLRNRRKKSMFVKNDIRSQRILQPHQKMSNLRRFSLPNIGEVSDNNINTYMDLIPDGNDYESIKYGSLASYASVRVPGIDGLPSLRRMTPIYGARPAKTSPSREFQIESERL